MAQSIPQPQVPEIIRRMESLEQAVKTNNEAVQALVIEVKEGNMQRQQDYELNSIQGKQVDSLKSIVFGHKDNNMVGLTTKVDRIEQTENTRLWNLRALWVAVIGVIASVLKDMINWR